MKQPLKPRNHIALALIKRKSGSGAYVKSNKAKRRERKIELTKELRRPSNKIDGFFNACFSLTRLVAGKIRKINTKFTGV